MFAALQTLHIIGLGFALMLGFLGPSGVLRSLARMMLALLLFPFAVSLARHVWHGLPPGGRVLALGAGLPLALLMLTAFTKFGRDVLAHFFGTLLHTVVVGGARLFFRAAGAVVRAPVRLFGWLLRR
jgi:hypothetical protein